MIKNMMRGLAALSFALPPLAAPQTAIAANRMPDAAEVLTITEAIERLPVAEESREGYSRDRFKHWNSGLDPADGCNTRAEVLLSEAIEAPTVSAGCKLTGGRWISYYDGQEVTDASKLDIDHMVPLAEAWDSGASAWAAKRREAYANDQGAASSLVAVTARTNRSKADQDPSEWLPPAPDATCRYLREWIEDKHRWGLSADQHEIDTLTLYADGPCEDMVIHYTPTP